MKQRKNNKSHEPDDDDKFWAINEIIDMSNTNALKSSITNILSNKEHSSYLLQYHEYLRGLRKQKLKERGNFINHNRAYSSNFAENFINDLQRNQQDYAFKAHNASEQNKRI